MKFDVLIAAQINLNITKFKTITILFSEQNLISIL